MDFQEFVKKQEKNRHPWLFIERAKGKGPGYHAPHRGRPGRVGGSRPRNGGRRAISFAGKSKEARRDITENLKATDVLQLYHGTRNLDTVRQLLEVGFDPTKRPKEGRIYAGTAAPEKGFFVSPDREVASSFGPYVIEFKAIAGNLRPRPDPTLPKGESADDFWRSSYPKSFSPGLSESLMLMESQGLLVRPVPRKQVKAVWTWDKHKEKWISTAPQAFLKRLKERGE